MRLKDLVFGLLPLSDSKSAWRKLKPDGKPVVVAIIDSGLDRDHEDFPKEHLWTNAYEISDNSIDDDHNGYVDDTWGWNFLAKNNRPHNPLFFCQLPWPRFPAPMKPNPLCRMPADQLLQQCCILLLRSQDIGFLGFPLQRCNAGKDLQRMRRVFSARDQAGDKRRARLIGDI